MKNRKAKVALLSVASNTTLIVLKVIAGIMSGSVSIISEAIHSSMDLAAAVIAFFSVRVSAKPADKDHPYGHGKVENVSGVIEGLLIFVAAFLIIREAVKKLMSPEQIAIESAWIAIAVMVFSGLVNTVVSRILYKVAKEEDSIALEADALHLKTDVLTSLGVASGILLIKLTGLSILDPIAAILVACLIIKESWVLCINAFRPLLDSKLNDEEEKAIAKTIDSFKDEIIDFHKMRTRKSGGERYIDFHLTLEDNLSVKQAHDLTEKIQKAIEAEMRNARVHIHVEPRKAPDCVNEK